MAREPGESAAQRAERSLRVAMTPRPHFILCVSLPPPLFRVDQDIKPFFLPPFLSVGPFYALGFIRPLLHSRAFPLSTAADAIWWLDGWRC